jgi:phosphopantetheine--protein transferase-like protein
MLRTPPPAELASAWLSQEETSKLLSYRKPADRWRLLLGRAILRRVLHNDHNVIETDIWPTAEGKPVLANSYDKRLDFSITHDGPWVAVGTTTKGRIGIDISEIASFRKWSEFVSQYLDPGEINQLRNLPSLEAPLAAARFWTIKEAILKATGHGLELDPRKIILDLTSLQTIRQLPRGLPEPDLFHLEELERPDGCWLAIARLYDKATPTAPSDISELSPEALLFNATNGNTRSAC